MRYSQRYLRKSDLLGPVGGEEFALLLIETNPPNAKLVADRLRQKISEMQIPIDDGLVQFTVSIGITSVSKMDESLETLFKRADEALYRAKAEGRNRVVNISSP